MANQAWTNLLNYGVPWQTTNGTALSASASTATISPQAAGPQDFILPAQFNGTQWYTGMTLRVRARGVLASGGTASTLIVFLAAGVSGTLGTTLSTSGALTLGTGSITNIGWRLEALARVVAVGSTGTTLSVGGDWIISGASGANTGTLGTANTTFMTLPETTTAFNTYTQATALGLRATLSAAFGSVQCNQFTIEQLD